MCATESDHFLNGESSGFELANELRDRHGRKREEICEERGFGDSRVAAAEEDVVVRTTDGDEEVTSGDGDDVGARDGVWAS